MKSSEFDEKIARQKFALDEARRKEYYNQNQKPEPQPIKRQAKAKPSKQPREETIIEITTEPSSNPKKKTSFLKKLIKKPTIPKASKRFKLSNKKPSKKLQAYFLKYGQPQKASRPKQPSKAQILQRQRFAEMVRQNAMLKRQIQTQNSNSSFSRSKKNTANVVLFGQGRNPQPSFQRPQFQRPEARGVWQANPNSMIASKMPRNERIWRHRPIYGLEGDLMGNIKIREFGTEASFFN